MRVLYLEPDLLARQLIEPELLRRGLSIEWAGDERTAFERLANAEFDALIVDSDPAEGLDFVALLGAAGVDIPAVSMISAVPGDLEPPLESAGFRRPFCLDELVLRIHRISRRRTTEPTDGCLRVHDLELDLRAFYVERAGVALDLDHAELALLEYLMRNEGRCLTPSMIAENALRDEQCPAPEDVDLHLERLRRKIDRGFSPPLLHSEPAGVVLEHRKGEPLGARFPSSL